MGWDGFYGEKRKAWGLGTASLYNTTSTIEHALSRRNVSCQLKGLASGFAWLASQRRSLYQLIALHVPGIVVHLLASLMWDMSESISPPSTM
jgi:hypothetical protein